MRNSSPASELRYRRLFETARDGLLILDAESRRIIEVNPYLGQLLAIPHDDFIDRELCQLGRPSDREAFQAAIEEVRTTGFARHDRLPLCTRDGRLVDVEIISNLYDEGEHRVIQCNIRDIRERKHTEAELLAAREQLSRHVEELESAVDARTSELRLSNQQLETFVYSIAHDLRAPLRTMQAFSDLLVLEHSSGLDEQGTEYVNFINKAAQTMDHLLADLLAFSRVSQQKIELQPVPLADAVQDAIVACDQDITRRGARVESIPPWPSVFAHAATLRQVLVNLITNALKFTSDRPPVVRLHCEERDEGIVRVWIEDNGIGIEPEYRDRIFQVFQRLHSSEYEGTGIGLAIVKKGVERMGGQVGVESTPDVGSKFWVELVNAHAKPPKLTGSASPW